MIGIIGLLIAAIILKAKEKWHIAVYLVSFVYLILRFVINILPYFDYDLNSYVIFANRLVIPALLMIVFLKTKNKQKAGDGQ